MPTALIVGAGASGLLHSLALKSAGVPIAAVYDPNAGRARLLSELVGGQPYWEFQRVLDLDCRVAAICSPPIHHVAQAEALARPGRLTLLEKPVALSEGELIRLSAYANIVPTLQWRAGRSAQQLRAAVAAGAFGATPQLRCDLRLWRDAAYYEDGRRGLAQWGCGAMLSIGIHAIDLAIFILNRPVTGAYGREWRGRDTLDVTTQSELAIDFDGGATAKLRLTTDAKDCNDVHISVRGEHTSATLVADESDPTASALSWSGSLAAKVQRDLVQCPGATGSPLLVPFVHEAVAAFRSGRPTISIADVADAHRIACALERV